MKGSGRGFDQRHVLRTGGRAGYKILVKIRSIQIKFLYVQWMAGISVDSQASHVLVGETHGQY